MTLESSLSCFQTADFIFYALYCSKHFHSVITEINGFAHEPPLSDLVREPLRHQKLSEPG